MSKKKSRWREARRRTKHLHLDKNEREPDLEIDVDTADPIQAKALDEVLQEAEKVGVKVFTKTYEPKQKHSGGTTTVGEPYFYTRTSEAELKRLSNDPDFIGRSVEGDHMIANELLKIVNQTPSLAPPLEHDDRPLVDRLHEATFSDAPGLHYIKDKYTLRMLLRKAHCFLLDEVTSELIADFATAIADDLDASRQMAIPPFPVTWIDIDNRARLRRTKELGIPLTKQAEGKTAAGAPVERVGWLIQPDNGGYYATYATCTDEGSVLAPLSYWWHHGSMTLKVVQDLKHSDTIRWLTFGMQHANVHPYDTFIGLTPLHVALNEMEANHIYSMMGEIAGELRYIWGFLIALGAGHLGASAQYSAQAAPTRSPPIMKNGKPLLPLEHKVLHLHLNKKPPAKLIAQAITHHHNRRHDVRAHWRQLKSGKRVPVASHQRGDEKLGRIEKTYRVER